MTYSVDIAAHCDGCGEELGRNAFSGSWGEIKQQATRPTLPKGATEDWKRKIHCQDCKETRHED